VVVAIHTCKRRPTNPGNLLPGAFISRGGMGLRPPKGNCRAVNNGGFGPQTGEGVALEQVERETSLTNS
jgi:hypothetical protein